MRDLTIPEIELLSADQEVQLAVAIEVGLLAAEALANGQRPAGASAAELVALSEAGRAAQRHFYLANLRMVATLAHNWAKRTDLPVDDLFQEGCVGLGEAIRRWDHQRGHRFTTLAWRQIDHKIAQAARLRCGQLQATSHQARYRYEIQRERERLEASLGRQITISELASLLGRDLRTIQEHLHSTRPVALSEDLLNLLPDRAAEPIRVADEVPVWLTELPTQESVVLRARYGIGEPVCTHAVLAERLAVSASTVRRIEARALNRARRLVLGADEAVA